MKASPDVDGGSAAEREIRVALVLYGGVSLAVYENGVTRSFFDLVKGNGVFGLVHHLLGSHAVVDVVAGTSAGGINGLLLAAALESGADFAPTADIWRRSGDLGALLRPVGEAGVATSLLSGDYYQRELTKTFERLIREKGGEPCDFEMDVFVTGTDLHGRVERYTDALGRTIEDKSHRVVFQLKHRPGRKHLGLGTCTPEERAGRAAEQARILASIARITSSFPAAFPPFLVEQVDEPHREPVARALAAASGVQKAPSPAGSRPGLGDRGRAPASRVEDVRAYVDGGVLHNKPFGPAREAIFYRMPRSAVDRRLFYVEPDPQRFDEGDGGKGEPSPLGVIVAALTAIPGHQSIGEDLEAIRRHNARIRWLRELEREMADLHAGEPGQDRESPEAALAYARARIDSLAKSLALDIEEPPSAEMEFPDRRREDLFLALRDELGRVTKKHTLEHGIDPFDVDFHLRRTFHELYRVHRRLTGGGPAGGARDQVVAIGRVVKLLKIVRSALVQTRTLAVERALASGMDAGKAAVAILGAFRHVLDADFPAWRKVVEEAGARATAARFADREGGPLASRALGEALKAAQAELAEQRDSLLGRDGSGRSVLAVVEAVLTAIVAGDGAGGGERLARFRRLDHRLFPLEYASGIHELDEIEFYRISPRDAQQGLSQLPAESKVTGDEVAHFAAFFRRDWRSNDILWGRLDAIGSILEALLDAKAMATVLGRKGQVESAMSAENLDRWFPARPSSCGKVRGAWERFAAAGARETAAGAEGRETAAGERERAEAWRALRDALIEAGQRAAVAEDLERVLADGHFQDVVWGMREAANGASAASPEDALENAAQDMAKQEVLGIDGGDNLGDHFRDRRMGDEKVWGKDGRVPANILGEYGAQAGLMVLGMLASTLRGSGRATGFLERSGLRHLLRAPALAVHHLLAMMRRKPKAAMVLVVGAGSALVAAGAVAAALGEWLALAVAALALFGVLALLWRLSPLLFRRRWAGWIMAILSVLVLALAATVVGAAIAR